MNRFRCLFRDRVDLPFIVYHVVVNGTSLLPNSMAGIVLFACRSWNVPQQTDSIAAASVARKMAGPTPFCSWLMPGLVLMSSYIDAEVDKSRLCTCAGRMPQY